MPPDATSGARVSLRPVTNGHYAILRPPEEQIGEIRYHLRDGRLVFEQMEVTPALRGRGLGSEAVRLLEDWSRKRGTRGYEALVPKDRGLALYFWLRLGYRPAYSTDPEWRTGRAGDIISMIREASGPQQE